jgi:hypothetical protein
VLDDVRGALPSCCERTARRAASPQTPGQVGERQSRPARLLVVHGGRVGSDLGHARIHTEARLGAATLACSRATPSCARRSRAASGCRALFHGGPELGGPTTRLTPADRVRRRHRPNEERRWTRQPRRADASSPIVGVPKASVAPVRLSCASMRRARVAARAGAGRGDGGRGAPAVARKRVGPGRSWSLLERLGRRPGRPAGSGR